MTKKFNTYGEWLAIEPYDCSTDGQPTSFVMTIQSKGIGDVDIIQQIRDLSLEDLLIIEDLINDIKSEMDTGGKT